MRKYENDDDEKEKRSDAGLNNGSKLSSSVKYSICTWLCWILINPIIMSDPWLMIKTRRPASAVTRPLSQERDQGYWRSKVKVNLRIFPTVVHARNSFIFRHEVSRESIPPFWATSIRNSPRYWPKKCLDIHLTSSRSSRSKAMPDS